MPGLKFSSSEKMELKRRLLSGMTRRRGCWIYKGTKKNQYGHLQISVRGVSRYAHRIAYLVFKGPIPKGKQVCHTCDVPGCIRPRHLFTGTQLQNVRDMIRKKRNKTPTPRFGLKNNKATLGFGSQRRGNQFRHAINQQKRMHATYSITSDKLKAWFDSRLSTEDYQRARRAGFQFWHGSKCFAAKWSPTAEDFLADMGITEIQPDDQPDDVEARVERFAGYAESAEKQAESSQTYLDERANTERRRVNAINAIEKNLDAARHWQDRIAGAIRNAQYKERPDVIARRIRGLEADRRRHEKSFTPKPGVAPLMYEGEQQIFVGGGRGGHWIKASALPGIKTWAERWIAHIDRRLEYENACLVAAGGAPEVLRPERKKAVQPKGVSKTRNGKTPECLGAAGLYLGLSRQEIGWRLIYKVNRTSIVIANSQVTIDGSGKEKTTYYLRKEEIYPIADVKTRAEVAKEMPELHEMYEAIEAIKARNAERKAKAQQVAA